MLQLAVGLLRPDTGTVAVLGGQPGTSPNQLATVGFVAQDTPTYAGMSVRDHIRFGRRLNPGWDEEIAEGRLAKLGLDLHQKAGRL